MPNETTGQPAAAGAAPAAAPAPASAQPQGRDTFGDKKVDFSKIPIAGHQKGSRFIPAGEEGEPAPGAEGATADTETPPADGQPVPEVDPKAEATVIKAKNGKVFKDASEMLAAYDASAPEAVRLATENKTYKLTVDDLSSKVESANQTILKMQEYIANSAYQPNVPEKYKGMTESEMLSEMTEDEKLDYKLDKREWSKKVEAFKSQMSAAKAESEAIATATKAQMARAEQAMTADKATYPDFEELGPLRTEILKESPHLANRADAPYISYYMALGIVALREKSESARLEAQSRKEAEDKSKAAAAQGGAGGTGHDKGGKPKDDGLRGLVKAGKTLKGAF